MTIFAIARCVRCYGLVAVERKSGKSGRLCATLTCCRYDSRIIFLNATCGGPSQFNFYDHSKLILSSNGLLVTHIDKNYKMTRWMLTDLMAQALRLSTYPYAAADMPPDELKFHQRLMDKLKYCKEVLASIKTASVNGGEIGEDGDEEGMRLGMAASKMTLR